MFAKSNTALVDSAQATLWNYCKPTASFFSDFDPSNSAQVGCVSKFLHLDTLLSCHAQRQCIYLALCLFKCLLSLHIPCSYHRHAITSLFDCLSSTSLDSRKIVNFVGDFTLPASKPSKGHSHDCFSRAREKPTVLIPRFNLCFHTDKRSTQQQLGHLSLRQTI